MSCMMLSGLPRLVGGLHSSFFVHFSLLSRSLGGPESIMSHMMLSGLPRLVGALCSYDPEEIVKTNILLILFFKQIYNEWTLGVWHRHMVRLDWVL